MTVIMCVTSKLFQILANPNQNLFWSGTMTLIEGITKSADMITSFNTPSGAIINDMGNINWCGHLGESCHWLQCMLNVVNDVPVHIF